MVDGRILVLNPGSSSLKYGLYGLQDSSVSLLRAGTQERLDGVDLPKAIERVLRALREQAGSGIYAVGCRVVHGGERYVEPTRVTPEVIAGIRTLTPLAPLHNPAAADTLEACRRILPDVPLVAVFDTVFHQTLPEVARTYALPHELASRHGLRRFGFHGIAHQYVSERLWEELGRPASSRLITCHLGSGASVCAIRDRCSVDTSMGMTPMEGLMMGTRSGDVDPGILLYLLEHGGMTAPELDDVINHCSGLLGVSGVSGDFQDVSAGAGRGDARCKLAVELFAYRAAKTIAGYTAVLEGLDGLAFSGGIGEHSWPVRVRICERLKHLGVTLDEERNRAASRSPLREPGRITTDGAAVPAWVIPADEDLQIARETAALLKPP